MNYSRRDFLRFLALSSFGLLAGCNSKKAASANASGCADVVDICSPRSGGGHSPYQYTVPNWSGDNPAPMHRIREWYRNNSFPKIPLPSQKVDFVIVGGGLSGLTLAHYLNNESFLLLERETELGGNAKSDQFQGLTYAKGSAYLVDTSEPFGPLYESLGLKLKPVPHPDNLCFTNDSWRSFTDPKTDASLKQGFEKLRAHLTQYLTRNDFPNIPLQDATSDMLKLDKLSFYDYLKNDYPPALLGYIDAYCQSALGGSIQQISAFAGINFYSEITGDIVAFPDGNAAISKKLIESISHGHGASRIKTEVSVVQVEDKGNSVWVTYMNNNNFELTTVEAKHVVMATPFLISGRILKGQLKSLTDVLMSCQYGSYLVANCCFDSVPEISTVERNQALTGYDHWNALKQNDMAEPNKVNIKHNFTDFIVADWVSRQNHQANEKKPYVLTLYAPFANGSLGRQRMLSQAPDLLAKEMVDTLQKIVPFKPESLKEVRLTRYGHQLLRSEVGLIRRLASMSRNIGRIHLCHSDGQGMASIESAITEAYRVGQALYK